MNVPARGGVNRATKLSPGAVLGFGCATGRAVRGGPGDIARVAKSVATLAGRCIGAEK